MPFPLQKSDIEIPEDSKEKTEWLKYRNEGQPFLNEDLIFAIMYDTLLSVEASVEWGYSFEKSTLYTRNFN